MEGYINENAFSPIGNAKQKSSIQRCSDIINVLFVCAGAIMLIALPPFSNFIPQPLETSVFATIAFALVAGATHPTRKYIAFLNMIVAASAFRKRNTEKFSPRFSGHQILPQKRRREQASDSTS